MESQTNVKPRVLLSEAHVASWKKPTTFCVSQKLEKSLHSRERIETKLGHGRATPHERQTKGGIS